VAVKDFWAVMRVAVQTIEIIFCILLIHRYLYPQVIVDEISVLKFHILIIYK